MSGGSYDYGYLRIEEIADKIASQGGNSLLRKAFVKHLFRVAEACHAIEWVDSADWSPGDEIEPIRDCFEGVYPAAILQEAREQAEALKQELDHLIQYVDSVNGR